ncbi:MAG: bacteriohemerythrin [Alphaproteobacteria bacterium]|nr:bacteriohemerythrin [Alphaproteobacteria bacterium]
MQLLKNIKISRKIYGGFGVVLGLLLIIAIVGFFSLKGAGNNFTEYRSLARQTNQAGRIQANMLMTRLFVKNFVISASKDNISGVRKRAQTTLELIPKTRELTTDPEFLKTVDLVEIQLKEYISQFDKVTVKQEKRNDLVNKVLNVTGPQMEKKLTEIMESAFADGDAEGAYRAGITLRNLLLGRLYVAKFLVENDQNSYQRVIKEMTAMTQNEKDLLANLQNPHRKQLAQEINDLHAKYVPAFKTVYQTINERNKIIKGELDRIGPIVADEVEKLKLAIKGLQDELGPRAAFDINQAISITAIISVIAVIAGLLAAFFIGTGISRPITSMTTVMGRLAEGQKDSEIPAQDHGDEVGLMAKAVQVFKESMIKADELSVKQKLEDAEKENESIRIQKLIQDFELTIVSVLDSLTEADRSMRKAATDVKATSESTKNESEAVASAASEASTNVETVASAAEELSSSISEISRQVLQSNSVSEQAVHEADKTSEQIRVLEENVSKIGEVVSLINDIADQTNLLALNATIEAARAGDAGKGFAVVASEVKNLATQTSSATDEISAQISEVQRSTQEAVQAINSISGVIGNISEISSSISAAVEEQGAATQEIARNVEQAASGTQSVSVSIADVLNAAEKSDVAADEISHSSSKLSEQTSNLQSRVASFLREVQHDNVENAELLPWTNEYETGISSIDQDHQKLLGHINNLYRKIKSGDISQINPDEISMIRGEYADHFKGEEIFMEQRGYARLQEHRNDHRLFLQRLRELEADFNTGDTSHALELMSLLSNWWQKHAEGEDRHLTEYANNHLTEYADSH